MQEPVRSLRTGGETSSRDLRARAAKGDQSAWNRLLQSQTLALRRWAHRRLPHWARSIADTSDLVQDAMLRTLARIDVIQVEAPGALQAYLRQCVMNRIADEHRRVGRRGVPEALDPELQAETASPLDAAIGVQLEERYKAALSALRETDRLLIVGRVEMDYTLEQLACVTQKTVPATRMALRRALLRLAEELNRLTGDNGDNRDSDGGER